MEANDAMPKGYSPHTITEPPVSSDELADRILLGLRLRAVARRALKMGTVAAVATVALTGVNLSSGSAASATTTVTAPIVCQHTAVFGRGVWADLGGGDVWVSAPLREYVPRIGWLPSPWAEVDVQKLTRGRWVILARLHTSAADGTAQGVVHVGGGVNYLRVVHPADSWTRAATGSTRRVVVTTEPLDTI